MPWRTPDEEAAYALDYGVDRSELTMPGQLAYDRIKAARKSPSVARPGTGDQVRDMWFWQPRCRAAGYDPQQVDDLVRRIAAELDAGRPAGQLIENMALRKLVWGERYDVDAVDWFLGQFLLAQGHFELAGITGGPWRDLPVTQLAQVHGVSVLTEPYPSQYRSELYVAEQCENAWRDFGQLPGIHLWWGPVERRMKLRTAEQQTLVSGAGFRSKTFSAGGKRFTYRRASVESSSPGVAELTAHVARDHFGHFTRNGRIWTLLNEPRPDQCVRELVGETGAPVLYTCGKNFDGRASACIMFPDQRWLRFLVRGTRRANAIMTAVDQAGNRVARYRIVDRGLDPGRKGSFGLVQSRQIIVHPGWELTDELALALAISCDWLGSYFERPGG
jgi:hypothetical protein